MLFWLVISFSLFTILLVNEFGSFPYYSYFDKHGIFWIRKYFFFKTPLELSTVVRATLTMSNDNDPTPYIELWTADRFYKIRQTGIFCYKSNVELLSTIKQINPHIDTSNAQLTKYIGAKSKKGFYIIDEHVGAYVLLTISFLFTVYFLYRYIFG